MSSLAGQDLRLVQLRERRLDLVAALIGSPLMHSDMIADLAAVQREIGEIEAVAAGLSRA